MLPGSGSTDSQGESAASTRFLVFSTSGRWDIWRVAWEDFRDSPALGLGAGNYVYSYDREGRRETRGPQQPHSWELRVLSETGAVGGVLFAGVFLLGIAVTLWPRFRSGWDGVRRETQPGRWGADPRRYAWETMLVVAVLYWMIHGSVEWLWHMPGVSLPAVLMLALGVASVDARAEGLGLRTFGWMQDARANRWFQRTLVGAAAVTLVALALPYLSLRFQDSALGMIGTDDQAALRGAAIAAHLQPVDPQPLLTEADIYRLAAAEASPKGALDDLALSLDAHIRAVERDPTSWTVHYRAGVAALRLLEASTGDPIGAITGTGSAGAGGGHEPSLATGETEARARQLRLLTPSELALLARSYFVQARERRPLNPQVREGLAAIDAG